MFLVNLPLLFFFSFLSFILFSYPFFLSFSFLLGFFLFFRLIRLKKTLLEILHPQNTSTTRGIVWSLDILTVTSVCSFTELSEKHRANGKQNQMTSTMGEKTKVVQHFQNWRIGVPACALSDRDFPHLWLINHFICTAGEFTEEVIKY